MTLGESFRRWRWHLLAATVIVLFAVAFFFVTLPLRESDKTDAARNLVLWIIEGRTVPGFGENYPDAQHMPKRKRFFVACDFLPAGVSLSDDPRVRRIAVQEYDKTFKEHRFDDTDYIFIQLKSESGTELVLELSNVFGSLAGHGYRFEFRRTILGLRASGKFLWVS